MNPTFLATLLLLVGLALLIGGGDLLVRGAAGIAKRFGVSTFVIGLTVVAFGTSAPELVVALRAAFKGAPAIVFGNVLGSNIANVGLILGLTAMIYPVACHAPMLKREVVVMILASLLALGLLIGSVLPGSVAGELSHFDGAVLLGAFAMFLFGQFRRARAAPDEFVREVTEEVEIKTETRPAARARSPLVSWLIDAGFVLAGLGALVGGGELVVSNAVAIATRLDVDPRIIGLTIVAVGTSLPELASSIMAAYRRHPDMVLGNVIGSNIFNLLLILGATAALRPIAAPPGTVSFDAVAMLFFAGICVPIMLTGRRIGRLEGAGMIVAYVIYLTLAVTQGT